MNRTCMQEKHKEGGGSDNGSMLANLVMDMRV